MVCASKEDLLQRSYPPPITADTWRSKSYTIGKLQLEAPTTGITASGFPLYTIQQWNAYMVSGDLWLITLQFQASGNKSGPHNCSGNVQPPKQLYRLGLRRKTTWVYMAYGPGSAPRLTKRGAVRRDHSTSTLGSSVETHKSEAALETWERPRRQERSLLVRQELIILVRI